MNGTTRWPLERVLFALAGTVTLLSAALAAVVSPWFLLLTAFVGDQPVAVRGRRRLSGVRGAASRLPAALGDLRERGQLPREPEGGGDPMSVVDERRLGESRFREEYPHAVNVGPIGRLGRYTATHFRVVLVGWLVVAIGLGFFAPKVETALSGAGWETTGSQSVQARQLIDKNFHGLSSYALMTVIYSPTQTINDPAFKSTVAKVEATLRADNAVRGVVAPTPGVSISRDGHTAIVQAGAARSSNGMVKAADSLKGKLAALSTSGGAGPPDRRVGDVV